MDPDGNEKPDPVLSPVEDADPARGGVSAEPGIALCLSGGGYRAMLFHLGALWRLNELGWLPRLARVSSVSGGSIIAGWLGLRWSQLDFDASGTSPKFRDEIGNPIRRLAGRTIDAKAVIGGALLPGSIAEWITKAYRTHLFGDATLQDLPDQPRFVINATSVQSAVLWRFSKPYMGDYRVGRVSRPSTPLAVAVAASAAFPPVLSPVELELHPDDFIPASGMDLQTEAYTTRVVLCDGGVYDNLGLETAWKRYDTILVSDGGGHIDPEPEPEHDWVRHAVRILEIIDNQVRSLRVRQVVGSFQQRVRKGAYWGIRTDIAHYGLHDALACPYEHTLQLAKVATRLKRLEPEVQDALINWGYAVCDAAMRAHVNPELPPPQAFPYPRIVA